MRVGRVTVVAFFVGMATSMGTGCGSEGTSPVNQAGGLGGTGGAGSGATQTSVTGSGGAGTGGVASGGPSGTGGSSSGSGGTGGGASIPEGNDGIAAKHPGDVGIESDPAVIFADGFEDDAQASDLNRKWDAVYQNQQIRIATESANVYRGSKALEFTVPQMTAELSNATDKVLTQERDVLFLR